jgi:hypothetical protein
MPSFVRSLISSQITPPSTGLKIRIPALHSLNSSNTPRICTIRNCKNVLSDGYRWKMCTPCREYSRRRQKKKIFLEETQLMIGGLNHVCSVFFFFFQSSIKEIPSSHWYCSHTSVHPWTCLLYPHQAIAFASVNTARMLFRHLRSIHGQCAYLVDSNLVMPGFRDEPWIIRSQIRNTPSLHHNQGLYHTIRLATYRSFPRRRRLIPCFDPTAPSLPRVPNLPSASVPVRRIVPKLFRGSIV